MILYTGIFKGFSAVIEHVFFESNILLLLFVVISVVLKSLKLSVVSYNLSVFF